MNNEILETINPAKNKWKINYTHSWAKRLSTVRETELYKEETNITK